MSKLTDASRCDGTTSKEQNITIFISLLKHYVYWTIPQQQEIANEYKDDL